MSEFKESYIKWRMLLFTTNCYFAVIIFTVETAMYFYFKSSSLVMQPENIYLLYYLIIPTGENLLILLCGYFLLNKLPEGCYMKNYIPSIQLALLAFVVACAHSIFYITLSAFYFPVFSTIIFGNKKMTRRTGAFCSLLLILTLIHGVFSQSRLRRDVYFWVEGFIALLILFCATLLCDVFIKFQEEKNNIIRLDYLNQLLLQDKLNKDPKTGLYAHEIFKNTLNRKIKNAENTGKPVVLAVIDIDNFKKINDIYGHLKGDQVIITLANVMKKYKNDHCFISRFGGEEFAVIFTEVETQQAYALLEKLRLDFQDEK